MPLCELVFQRLREKEVREGQHGCWPSLRCLIGIAVVLTRLRLSLGRGKIVMADASRSRDGPLGQAADGRSATPAAGLTASAAAAP